jgi:phage-related protein
VEHLILQKSSWKMSTIGIHRRLPVMEQAKIRNVLRLLQEFGTSLGLPHAKPIQGKPWENRPGGIRLFYFTYIEKQFVILHGYRKQSQKAPGREIEIALKRMEELMDEVQYGSKRHAQI